MVGFLVLKEHPLHWMNFFIFNSIWSGIVRLILRLTSYVYVRANEIKETLGQLSKTLQGSLRSGIGQGVQWPWQSLLSP